MQIVRMFTIFWRLIATVLDKLRDDIFTLKIFRRRVAHTRRRTQAAEFLALQLAGDRPGHDTRQLGSELFPKLPVGLARRALLVLFAGADFKAMTKLDQMQ